LNIKDLWRQFIKLIPILALIYIPGVVFISLLYVVYRTTGISFGNHFIDDGLVSNTGILFLASTAAVCIFGYFFIKNREGTSASTRFLLFFGLYTTLLTIDDFFMIHEAIGNSIATHASVSDNIGEDITFAVYILIFAFYMFKYRKVIYHTEYLLFIFALILLGFSILLEFFSNHLPDIPIFKVEEIYKFLGIITWFAYGIRTAFKLVNNPEPSA